MKWGPTDEVPKIGEWLRRRDTGRFARVDHIAEIGKPNPSASAPLYEGDVVLNYGPGHDAVTSGGPYFWEKWERPDTETFTRTAIAVGCGT